MTDSPTTKTAEQIAAGAITAYWRSEERSGAGRPFVTHDLECAAEVTEALRVAGLLVSGAPSEEHVALIAEANQYFLNNAEPGLRGPDLVHRLATALTAAGVTPTAPVDREKLRRAAFDQIHNCEPRRKFSVAEVKQIVYPLLEGLDAALAGVGSPVPVQVDEAKLAGVINDALDAWQGEERSEVFVAHKIAEWWRGGAQ